MDQSQPPNEPGRRGGGHPRSGYGPTPGYGYYEGYGYGDYGGYGGYPSAQEHPVQRTLQDYILILRERIWYIAAVFVVVFASAAIFTYTQTPVFQAESTVQIFRKTPTVMLMQAVTDSDVRSAEDFNTQVNLLKNNAIIDRVAARLVGQDQQRFLEPYLNPKQTRPPTITTILERNRNVVPQRLSLIVDIEYRHADPAIAAKVADLFADEFISYNATLKADDTMRAVEDLKKRANVQRLEVDRLAGALQVYREKNNLVSLDQRKDISTDTLKELSLRVTQSNTELQQAETRWKQVQESRMRGESPVNLSFIASDPAVTQLHQDVAAQRIAVAKLRESYRAGHPAMIEGQKQLDEAEAQLKQAVDRTTSQVETSFNNATQNLAKARDALAAQSASSFDLDRAGLSYSNLEREYNVAKDLLEEILKRSEGVGMSSAIETQGARLVYGAKIPIKPISPNIPLNLALGTLGGIALGVGLAFFIAFIDDRVKSAYDIEAVVGLPLLAIVPRFKTIDQVDQAGSATFSALKEPEIAEAFSTLYSSLRLKDQSKVAKCIVVTSTVPGEGKSFISRNLAMTFASHGERVLLMDCDLRRPVAHRPFQVENTMGVIDICLSEHPVDGALIDGATIRNVQPNLDLMPSGGRSKNPAQNLTSKNFEVLLAELRKRYDRIIIDTPPVALVSDALVILPLADGSIYSIYFNKVRRKAAQFCARRILDINIPTFGAVLNGLDQNIGGYYYHHYYDKKYKDYYAAADDDTGARGGAKGPGKPTS